MSTVTWYSFAWQVDIEHELLAEILAPIQELKNDVKRKAVMR